MNKNPAYHSEERSLRRWIFLFRKILTKKRRRKALLGMTGGVFILFLTSCAVGPNYVSPIVEIPTKWKEAPKGWKIASPCDDFDRGQWWQIFNDPQLNALEAQVNVSNQNIISAVALFMQARALVAKARASFYPVLAVDATLTRQKGSGATTFSSFSPSGSVSSGAATTGTGGGGSTRSTSHTLFFDATWEPDLWGNVRRMVEASAAGAQASAAELAVTRLSVQASLAQFYFQIRNLDSDQQLLDNTVKQYKITLKVTQNRYAVGTVAKTDVVQARSQLETAQAASITNKINRATTEHAIAILLGKPPAEFSLPVKPLTAKPPKIPVEIPSALLERRPDVAQAERLVAQANAQIGVAIAAYYPVLTLTGTASYTHPNLNDWFSIPGASWSAASQLAETILDGGLRDATVDAARAAYYSSVALYRETVLTAFQNVEDTLVTLRLLKVQAVFQRKAAQDLDTALKAILNQYKAGTVDYTTVVVAQNLAYTAEKTYIDSQGLVMVAAVNLIKALGGGWDAESIVNAAN